jgi:plastocyanin
VRLRRRHLPLAVLLGFVLALVPAIVSSATGGPEVTGTEMLMWSPASVSVSTGASVTFKNPSTSIPHGIVWENAGNPETPSCTSGVPVDEGKTNWSGSCTFAKQGVYKFYCAVHGMAMHGEIDVNAQGTTTTSSSASSTSTSNTTTSSSAGESTKLAPPGEEGKSGSGGGSGSPFAGGPTKALRLARTQHGHSVHGSIDISQAGAGGRLEVQLLAGHGSLAKAAHARGVRLGRLVLRALKAGRAPFTVGLDALGRRALQRHGSLALTVEVTVTPSHGSAATLTRTVSVRA